MQNFTINLGKEFKKGMKPGKKYEEKKMNRRNCAEYTSDKGCITGKLYKTGKGEKHEKASKE